MCFQLHLPFGAIFCWKTSGWHSDTFGVCDAHVTAVSPAFSGPISSSFFLLLSPLYSAVFSQGQWDSHRSPNIVSKCEALLIILRKNVSVIGVESGKRILKQCESRSMGLADAGCATFSGPDLPAAATSTQGRASQQAQRGRVRSSRSRSGHREYTSADCRSRSSFISIFLVPLVSHPFLTQSLFNKKALVLFSHC